MKVFEERYLHTGARALANLALVGAWLWLFRPVLAYLAVLFTREEFRTNQILLAMVLGLLVVQARRSAFRPHPAAAPRWHLAALALALCAALLYVAAQRWLKINTLAAFLFGLGSYGLAGLWMEPARWRSGLLPMLLVTGVLPFGEHMETFIGYPVRRATAGIVAGGMRAMSIPTAGADTILVFESGISQVDIPCSGVKSLWTGALFWLAATWIEKRRLGLRWLFSGLAFAVLLLLANLARVAALAGVGQVLGWRLAAEMIHVPLGILGFVASCAAGLWLLRRLPERGAPPERVDGSRRPVWLAASLAGLALALGFFVVPAPQPAAAPAPVAWQFPVEIRVEDMPLTAEEAAWLAQGGAERADRYRFQYGEVSGSMILVSSSTWRGQHRPERCFEVYGLDTRESFSRLVGPAFPVRVLALESSGLERRYQAAYWFESARQTTEDYGARIWADFTRRGERWILVTVLLDEENPSPAAVDGYYTALHEAVQRSLIEGRIP